MTIRGTDTLGPVLSITNEQLSEITQKSVVGNIATPLAEAMHIADIKGGLRAAHFITQIAHETGGFKSFVERLDYTPEQAVEKFGARASKPLVWSSASKGEKVLANVVYGGRWGTRNLGNFKPDDGHRYRGRGALMIRGRSDYAAFSWWLNEVIDDAADVFDFPDLVGFPRWAMLAAAWFWWSREINDVADRDELLLVSLRVRTSDDLDERWELLRRAKDVLGVTEVEDG